MNNTTAEVFVILTGVAWVAIYAVLWSGHPLGKNNSNDGSESDNEPHKRIVLMTSKNQLSLWFKYSCRT
jgi:hypothetical protein